MNTFSPSQIGGLLHAEENQSKQLSAIQRRRRTPRRRVERRAENANRRARSFGQITIIKTRDVIDLLELQQSKCAICGRFIDLYASKSCELDHWHALFACGLNMRHNLVLLCLPCHAWKALATPEEIEDAIQQRRKQQELPL